MHGMPHLNSRLILSNYFGFNERRELRNVAVYVNIIMALVARCIAAIILQGY